ncbi:hypothetical protein [Enterococcus mundtii]|uniref:hypothetical protein n=1 Tax=Enterococcus mundtii TaxID=53346 RepID=UPI0035C6C6E9
MQSMRRFGAMLLILFFGIIIGNYGLQTALLIFLPSFVLWFVMWDEKNIDKMNENAGMKKPSINIELRTIQNN